MTARWSKVLLAASVAFFFTLVVFNNVTDFDSNYQFVRHVLSMDSTFPGNHGMWRAETPRWLHLTFYCGIIAWEALNAVLGWWGAWLMVRAIGAPEQEFQQSKRITIAALTSGMLLWFVAFITVGGEWFLMWQSRIWNGQEAAFRMFVVEGVVLMLLQMREPASPPLHD
jgi:predicted small integral membrane protein